MPARVGQDYSVVEFKWRPLWWGALKEAGADTSQVKTQPASSTVPLQSPPRGHAGKCILRIVAYCIYATFMLACRDICDKSGSQNMIARSQCMRLAGCGHGHE